MSTGFALDQRGHGDSEWSSDGNYSITSHVYDLAQLVQQRKLTPVRIVAHSLGANISLRYAGAFPENVLKLVAIEGWARLLNSKRSFSASLPT